jgi:hypothetical protein
MPPNFGVNRFNYFDEGQGTESQIEKETGLFLMKY